MVVLGCWVGPLAGLPAELRFDLVVGSDVLYEPHLFEDLLEVSRLSGSLDIGLFF